MQATFELEAAELRLSGGPIAGVDEAGRGPWAGPVVAAAVVLDPDAIPDGIADSKALDADTREALYGDIMRSARAVGVGIGDVGRIERDNILNATLWAMAEAVSALGVRPKLAIIDGNKAPRLRCATRTVIKGDAQCLSIAAASIIAKVTRDRIMITLAKDLPGYGFERHKGYGTPEHQDAIRRLGLTPHHRQGWKPVQLAMALLSADADKSLLSA
ncbi:MAG: ribonuclease HII [Hyphomicrobiaceae bacterium]